MVKRARCGSIFAFLTSQSKLQMTYTHLTREERYQIYALKQTGQTQKQIAHVLERSESTISRELNRNSGGRGYRPKRADKKATERRAINARRIDGGIWDFAKEKLKQQWSPEQISGHADISPETIYQRIYADKQNGGSLWKNLRCKKTHKKRYGKIKRRGQIAHRRFIENRPAIVTQRKRIGDWEADTIIGKNHCQAIVSIIERKSGMTLIRKVERKTAEAVSVAIISLLRPLKKKIHTITSDNGKEFAMHQSVEKALKIKLWTPPISSISPKIGTLQLSLKMKLISLCKN